MPVLALRGLVVYPKMMVHFDVGREASVKAVEEAMSTNSPVFLVAQKDIRDEDRRKRIIFLRGHHQPRCARSCACPVRPSGSWWRASAGPSCGP